MKFAGPSFVALLMAACPLHAQVVYNTTPDWTSTDTPYSTGGALVDLDRDGWTDFVVANGNDMRRERLAVYYNNGDGTLPTSPNWLSDDDEYNGHISLADVNGDGWLDVAVGLTVDWGAGTTGAARVYLNNAGTLSSLPDWQSPDEEAAFHVAFGDVNGDGRPDLAVGTGFPYQGTHRWHNYVYLNVNGTLESSPSWVSTDLWDYMEIFFCDVNDDGRLDLVGVGTGTDTWVYINNAGTLATTASWRTTDNPEQFSVMGTYGDVNGDDRPELFITDNTQLFSRATRLHDIAYSRMPGVRGSRGSGDLRRYNGLAGGLFATTPSWSYFADYGSAVALGDIDADGDLDMATGSWWGRTRYFFNNAGLFPAVNDWMSSGTSVVEAIYFGDVNRDGLRRHSETFDVTATPGRHLFQMPHQPIERIDSVTVDGNELNPEQFTFDLVHGWLSVGPEPLISVTAEYVYTRKPDMAITNWDDDKGNYLYYNENDAASSGDFDEDQDVDGDDATVWMSCFTGPSGGPVGPACAPGDFDADADVDCDDWTQFLLAWTVPAEPPVFPQCAPAPPLAAPFPHDRRKNRYISFDPNKVENDGYNVAFVVELKQITLGSCSGNGGFCREDRGADDCKICDVDGNPCINRPIDCAPDPPQSCVSTGQACVNDAPDAGGTNTGRSWWVGPESPLGNGVHLLVSEPFRKVSDNWPNPVHVGDCEVVPQARYAVRGVNDDTNGVSDEWLVETTRHAPVSSSWWGDCVGPLKKFCGGDIRTPECVADTDCTAPYTCDPAWTLPDGAVNVDDLSAALALAAPGPASVIPDVTWVDLHGNGSGAPGSQHFDPPNFVLNVSDIGQIIFGFQGLPYKGFDPADCPDANAWP